MSHRYLILGLLTERPMTGYDIKKHVKAALSVVTNASYGTLYPTLHKLLEEGAVEVDEKPQKGRPAKKVYQITPKGYRELEGWLQQPPAADQVRREFLLKLYLGKNLPREALLELVTTRREDVELLQGILHKELAQASQTQQLWVTEYALSLCKAELDWLERVEAQLLVASA